MRVRGSRERWLARAAALALLLAVPGARAGEWHLAGALACTDCHTMHNAKNGQPMRYDLSPTPASLLLRAENATALCLACHRDSATSQAPSVSSPSNGDPPGGGFPADLSDPSHRAHALGPATVMPPDGDTAVVMTCVTCHDPHGNLAYRNLRAGPSGARATPAPVVAQTVTADGTNAAQVYVRSNVRYVSGMSQWCMDCHVGLLASHSSTSDLPPHPWDRLVFGATSADWSAWSGTVANRVPVQNALGRAAPDDGDQVFCLSCHKAHGSPNPAALLYADGAVMSSTCLQCHAM